MNDSILSRLEASRKELLDLGLRNPLLNYKTPKARGLHIVLEKSYAVYNILVTQGKAMSFLGKPGKNEGDEELELPPLTEEQLEEAYVDTKLQTNETESKLQSKILNTYYFSRTSIEEQGINMLYVSLGMLNWYETGNATEVRNAPLVLIPVYLERSSAQERFRLRYTGSEIGPNLSLQAKMLADFNITIPTLADIDEFNIEEYFSDIENRIQHQSNWNVDRDAIELGFFSFGKFMIYHDLNSELWSDDNKPYNHPVIKALFGDGFSERPPTATEDHYLDTETNAHELFHVVDADSSQVLAMLAVHEGRHMVIQGPPGTGKSQTITNIIANAVGQGKKVLFVAEKMAALDVVKRRLDAINLGEACLELHSHKANKKELHEELKRILELGKPTLTHLQEEVRLLDEFREELNTYCSTVNTAIKNSGFSAQKVIGFLLQIAEDSKGIQLFKISLPDGESLDIARMNKVEAMADRIQAQLTIIGVPAELAFRGCKLNVLLPHEQEALDQILKTGLEATVALKKGGAVVASAMGLKVPVEVKESEQLVNIAILASRSPDLKELNITDQAWSLNHKDIVELLETGKQLSELRKAYEEIFIPEGWEQQILEIRQDILAYGDKWYKFFVGKYKASNKKLASLCKTTLPNDVATKLQYLDAISTARRLQNTVNELAPLANKLFGMRWQQLRTDWDKLSTAADYLSEVHQQIIGGRCPDALLDYLNRSEQPAVSAEYSKMLKDKIQQQEVSLQEVISHLKMDEVLRFAGGKLRLLLFQDQVEAFSIWIGRLSEIQHVIGWNNTIEILIKEKMEFLIQPSEQWAAAKEYLKIALQKAWYQYLIEQAMSDPALRSFERAGHEEVVEKFKQLDLLHLQYNRACVALKHWESVPRKDAGAGGQINILRSEFNRKVRHMPIRKLIQEAGLAIQAIKPVMMMSPMSIANFLHPGSIEFDLVIFDEASQVRPVEALGAAMRGKQLVVVGDTKQLPPTSFFDKSNSDIDDEENITADVQSILGMCYGKGMPERMLRWHYRSRHESLISLSNHEFYENRLVIFPSPGSKYRMGLAYHHLPEAIYDRGKTRSNPKEAEAVVDAVIEHAMRNPKQTLGVVAFSTAQMQAIQNALEIRRRKHPEVEGFFRSHPHEPFFVKNLENVQGDERDVVFISIGYGRIEDGKIPMSFGPLNNDGGEKRLNVLITRAKLRCEVFTNITSDDIKTTETSKMGIRSLKSFLYFAQHGKFEVAEEIPISVKRPFEDLVANKLNNLGYIIRKKVGSEGCYIDMAVVDPENPGRYLMGIECDGDAYASAKSARDRDRLRKQVLRSIGWNIHQLWSLDWFRNTESELTRLVAAIEKAKKQTAIDDIEVEAYLDEVNAIIRENATQNTPEVPLYELAILPLEIAQQELHLHPIGKLSAWIEDIVKIEGPVHFDETAQRMVRAAGLSKLGGRIRERLSEAALHAERNGKIKIKGDFLWHQQMETPVIRDRNILPNKKIQYISPEELCLGVKKVVENSFAIQPDALIPIVAKLFGFGRVTEDMKKELLEAVKVAIANGLVGQDGELLKNV